MSRTRLKLHVPPPQEEDSLPFPSRSATASPRASWRLHDPAIEGTEQALRRAQRSIEELERIFGKGDDDDRPRAA